MHPGIHIFSSVSGLTDRLTEEFYRHIRMLCHNRKIVSIALSGGQTPRLLFEKAASMATIIPQTIDWNKVHFFWGDERCVHPQHPESNFGMANRYLLRALGVKEANIHRIMGENDPEAEAARYAGEITAIVPLRNKVPVFDWIFLGLGEDGHTVSIFPDQMALLYADAFCAVAVHPQSGQKRITLTGKTLNHADRLTFMATGASKAQRVKEILYNEPAAKFYPARHVKPQRGTLEWYLDGEAAELLGHPGFPEKRGGNHQNSNRQP